MELNRQLNFKLEIGRPSCEEGRGVFAQQTNVQSLVGTSLDKETLS